MKIIQADFQQEGKHQWVLNHRGYRVVCRKVDSEVEIVIKAEIDKDPNLEDWKKLLRTVNAFYEKLTIAKEKEGGV